MSCRYFTEFFVYDIIWRFHKSFVNGDRYFHIISTSRNISTVLLYSFFRMQKEQRAISFLFSKLFLCVNNFFVYNLPRTIPYIVHSSWNPNFKKIQTFTHNLNECSVLKGKSLDFFLDLYLQTAEARQCSIVVFPLFIRRFFSLHLQSGKGACFFFRCYIKIFHCCF